MRSNRAYSYHTGNPQPITRKASGSPLASCQVGQYIVRQSQRWPGGRDGTFFKLSEPFVAGPGLPRALEAPQQ